MKFKLSIVADWIAPWAAALGFVVLTVMFGLELWDFRATVIGWAQRDLQSRTELAAHTLEEPLRTSDFRRLHAFGVELASEGVRLTVLSPQGGVFFDTQRPREGGAAMLFARHPCGEYTVRLGLTYAQVLAPVARARRGLALAGVLGALAVLTVFFLTLRQRLRIRELARLESFQRNFIADVSHEIKTPLTGILGSVELLESASDDQRGSLLKLLKQSAQRLNALVQSILELSRLESRRLSGGRTLLKGANTKVDLKALAREVVDACSALAAKHHANLRLAVPADSCSVKGDEELLARALTNLVVNALRYSQSPEVVVSLQRVDQRVELAVEDHGVGIPREHRAHVFDRFYRVEHSRSNATGGSGLGLAIVREIAEQHGGSVRLEPLSPSGCRFILSL